MPPYSFSPSPVNPTSNIPLKPLFFSVPPYPLFSLHLATLQSLQWPQNWSIYSNLFTNKLDARPYRYCGKQDIQRTHPLSGAFLSFILANFL